MTIPRCAAHLLICPRCGGGLKEIASVLHCETCSRAFPIRGGVPRFVAEPTAMDVVAKTFGQQWTERAAGAFEGDTLYGETREQELQTFKAGLALTDGSVKRLTVLDAGCGSGRLTAGVARDGAACVVGVDISDGVDSAARAVAGLENALIIQADITSLPLRPASFDIVWSEGVIHHTPDAHQAFRQLAKLVKPGGRMYVWVYPRSFHPYRLARDLLPFAWKLPRPMMLLLCRALAFPLWIMSAVMSVAGARRRSFGELAFGFHDNLSPRYQSRHTEDELARWFEDAGLIDLRFVGSPVGACARAPEPAP